MTWENYAIDIGSCYYLTKHYWQLKLLKFLDATFKKQCNVNKIGYTPLQLVKVKSCNLPRLTMGNKELESISEMEAVLEVMEIIL